MALTAQMRISRPTLREAVKALAEAGVLEVRRGQSGGIFVAPKLVKAVVDAPPFIEKRPLVMVEDAERNPLLKVPSPPKVAMPEVWSVPLVVLRTPTPRPPVK